ncbi:MAG: hypothetical protein ABSE51_04405 [Terracidiphilus sp.]|jgi:uncharacterized integral membrane protein
MNLFSQFDAGQHSLPYIVRNPADLHMLLRPRAILRPFNKPGILVRIPEFSPSHAQAWERRLEPLTQECGCNHGVVAVGAFLLLSVVAAFLAKTPDDVRLPLETYLLWSGCFVAGLILSAIAGKLFGQILAAFRLRRACRELEAELNLLRNAKS